MLSQDFSKIISQIKGENNIMKIPFSPPDITEKEIEQVSEALRSGWITTGPKTKELEREVADLCGVNRAVCLNSQTACAEMTLRLLGIKEGDEVITCAYTYTASASVVCHVGAKLILIDTQRDSLEMDYEQLENAITEKTKVIIPVDLGGVPCDYDRIFSIVERKKGLFHPANKIQESIGRVIVMADAAHDFGASWKEKPVGSIADFQISASMQLRILQLQKVVLLFGKILMELITKKFIISTSCYHFMVSQKMHLRKRSLGHGSMTSLDLGLNVI